MNDSLIILVANKAIKCDQAGLINEEISPIKPPKAIKQHLNQSIYLTNSFKFDLLLILEGELHSNYSYQIIEQP